MGYCLSSVSHLAYTACDKNLPALCSRVTSSPLPIVPPNPFIISSIACATWMADARTAYTVVATNNGLALKHSRQVCKRSGSDLYTSQTSPLGPRPNLGGSRMMPSYIAPRRASRCTNLTASSTIQRMGFSSSLDNAWFSRAQVTDFLDASM